jgi:hypothetical protein
MCRPTYIGIYLSTLVVNEWAEWKNCGSLSEPVPAEGLTNIQGGISWGPWKWRNDRVPYNMGMEKRAYRPVWQGLGKPALELLLYFLEVILRIHSGTVQLFNNNSRLDSLFRIMFELKGRYITRTVHSGWRHSYSLILLVFFFFHGLDPLAFIFFTSSACKGELSIEV